VDPDDAAAVTAAAVDDADDDDDDDDAVDADDDDDDDDDDDSAVLSLGAQSSGSTTGEAGPGRANGDHGSTCSKSQFPPHSSPLRSGAAVSAVSQPMR